MTEDCPQTEQKEIKTPVKEDEQPEKEKEDEKPENEKEDDQPEKKAIVTNSSLPYWQGGPKLVWGTDAMLHLTNLSPQDEKDKESIIPLTKKRKVIAKGIRTPENIDRPETQPDEKEEVKEQSMVKDVIRKWKKTRKNLPIVTIDEQQQQQEQQQIETIQEEDVNHPIAATATIQG